MIVYDFTGHLNPLPPGIRLPLQISGKVCLAADVREIHGELIRLAADLVRGTGLPSSFGDDHAPRRTRGYWLRELERAHDSNRELAMRLRKVADRLSPTVSARHSEESK